MVDAKNPTGVLPRTPNATSGPSIEDTPRRGRRRGPSGYAIVPDWSAGSYYILDSERDSWDGPYATRRDAELAIMGWLTAP
jgi:hypothetical protein